MNYYITCTRNGVSCCMSYEGQSQNDVNAMLSAMGATNIQFITEENYNIAVKIAQSR